MAFVARNKTMQVSYQIALLLGISLSVCCEIITKKYMQQFGGYIVIIWLFFSSQITRHYIAPKLDGVKDFVIIVGVFLISAFAYVVMVNIIKKLIKL